MTVGLATRVATATTFGVVAYNLFLSTTHVHNNRAYLVIVLAALAVAPCGRELSVDAWLRRRRGLPPLATSAPAWPLWLLRFEAAVVYGASGAEQAARPRLVRRAPSPGTGSCRCGTGWWRRPCPAWAVSLLDRPLVHTSRAKVIVLTELFIAIGLWWRADPLRGGVGRGVLPRRHRAHRPVEVFSYLAIAALVIWAVPSDPGPGARDRPAPARAPAAGRRRRAASTGWPGSASSRGPRAPGSPSSTATAVRRRRVRRRSPGAQPAAVDGVVRCRRCSRHRRPSPHPVQSGRPVRRSRRRRAAPVTTR